MSSDTTAKPVLSQILVDVLSPQRSKDLLGVEVKVQTRKKCYLRKKCINSFASKFQLALQRVSANKYLLLGVFWSFQFDILTK